MAVTNDAIEYIADQFLNHGIVAKREDIARVFTYEEKWWETQETDIEVAVLAHNDIVNYIMKHQPGMPRAAIEQILKLQSDAFNELG